jgi:hypothetical protein
MSTAVPRLLLDTFACLGPGGTDLIAPLVRLADGCEAAGVALCVDSAAWKEAEQDPDVRRRGVDLGAFARVQRLNTLSMPSNRDLSSRFVPVRNEADAADLRLLGALHARIADVLVTQDARVRRLADRAGIGARVLTLAEALTWVRRMQGQPMGLHVREAQPSTILSDPLLDDLLAQECDVFDPYLRTTLGENRGRAFIVTQDERSIGFAVLLPGAGGPQTEMQALAVEQSSLGSRPLEAMILAARLMARRRDSDLHVLLPPHSDFALLLLEQLGFERRGQDRHGRVRLVDSADGPLAEAHGHWMMHLDPAVHAALLPEIGGLAQQQLFAVDESRAGWPASGVRRQVALPRQAREPSPGDVVFTMHGRADSLAASRAVTAVLCVEQVVRCDNAAELKVACCRYGTLQASDIPGLLADGGATVLTLRMVSRLEHPVPFARLRQLGLVRSLPHVLRRLESPAVARLLPLLTLN